MGLKFEVVLRRCSECDGAKGDDKRLYAAPNPPRLSIVNSVATGAPALPPPPGEIARRLAPLCRNYGITRLEIYGSVARGDAQPGSDVDLVITLTKPMGWDYFTLDDQMSKVLGVRVHLLSRDQLDSMTNPFFKTSILADVRVIYDASHEAA